APITPQNTNLDLRATQCWSPLIKDMKFKNLMWLGYLDQAVVRNSSAFAEANKLGHHYYTLSHILHLDSSFHQTLGHAKIVKGRAEIAMKLTANKSSQIGGGMQSFGMAAHLPPPARLLRARRICAKHWQPTELPGA